LIVHYEVFIIPNLNTKHNGDAETHEAQLVSFLTPRPSLLTLRSKTPDTH